MNKSTLFAGLLAGTLGLGFLSGCTNKSDVQDARENVQEARQDATENINEAKADAAKEVNDAKKDAAENIQDAQKDLQDAKNRTASDREPASASGAATKSKTGDAHAHGSAATNTEGAQVTKETCDKLAAEKNIKPEQQATYQACQDMKKAKH